MGFTVVHYAGNSENSTSSLAAWAPPSVASVIMGTEVRNGDRADAFTPSGWSRVFNGDQDKDETLIAWNPDVWSKVASQVYRVTQDTFYRKSADRQVQMWAQFVALEHEGSGKRCLFSDIHLPSDVQEGKQWKQGDRKDCHWNSTKGWRSHMKSWGDEHKCGNRRVVAADWNVHLGVKDPFRQWANNKMDPMTLGWKGEYPSTHGDRCIDAFFLGQGVRTDGSERLAKDPCSDHRPVKTECSWA